MPILHAGPNRFLMRGFFAFNPGRRKNAFPEVFRPEFERRHERTSDCAHGFPFPGAFRLRGA